MAGDAYRRRGGSVKERGCAALRFARNQRPLPSRDSFDVAGTVERKIGARPDAPSWPWGHNGIAAFAADLLPRLQADPPLGRFSAHRGADGVQATPSHRTRKDRGRS
jgi:hypothetical protein